MKLQVRLNGTETNPFAKWGLTQNPFPQTGKAEYDGACLRMQSLGGEPIPHDRAAAYIREKLQGFEAEFVALCVQMFQPGKMVAFEVTFDERAR